MFPVSKFLQLAEANSMYMSWKASYIINHDDGQAHPVLPERICVCREIFPIENSAAPSLCHYSTFKIIACITIQKNARKLVLVVRNKIFKMKLNFCEMFVKILQYHTSILFI